MGLHIKNFLSLKQSGEQLRDVFSKLLNFSTRDIQNINNSFGVGFLHHIFDTKLKDVALI